MLHPVIPNDKVDFPVPEAARANALMTKAPSGTTPHIPPSTLHDKPDFPIPQADDLGTPLLEIARPTSVSAKHLPLPHLALGNCMIDIFR